jgi:hypothetical protein
MLGKTDKSRTTLHSAARCALVAWFWLLSGASLGSLPAMQGCTAPAEYARSGRVLDAGRFRLSGSTTMGVAPVRTRVRTAANARSGGATTTTYTDYRTTKGSLTTSGIEEIVLGPLLSLEAQVSYSPWGRCEIGALFSMIRVGAELRCGALPGELGPLQMALSAGIARLVLIPPIGQEFRAGVDLSLAGRQVSPLLDIYIARMPWRRGTDLGTGSQPTLGRDRTEWRLSIPVGVEFHVESPPTSGARRVVLALIPEITFASRDWPPKSDPRTM